MVNFHMGNDDSAANDDSAVDLGETFFTHTRMMQSNVALNSYPAKIDPNSVGSWDGLEQVSSGRL